MKWRQLGIVATATLLSIVVAFIALLVILLTLPVDAWFRSMRLLGLSFNVAGALTSVIPRALRDPRDIEELAKTKADKNPDFEKWLLRDTRTAQTGMVILGTGFALQLLGNLG